MGLLANQYISPLLSLAKNGANLHLSLALVFSSVQIQHTSRR